MDEFEEDDQPARATQLDFSGRASGDGRSSSRRAGRAAKMRILTLLGLLLLVVVAMKEAGKPERWMWLGFDRPADSAIVSDADVSDGDIVLSAQSLAAQSPAAGENSSEEPGNGAGFMPDRIASRLDISEEQGADRDSTDQRSADTSGGHDPQLTPVAVDFWRATFLKLSDSQQESLYQLLRRIDTARLQAPPSDLSFDATVKRLIELQRIHQSKTLGELAAMPQGDQKNELNEDLFALDLSWQNHVLPSLKASMAGDDFSISDQAAIRSVRSTIDPIVLNTVQDMTGIGNPRDKLAWLGIWDSVQRDAETLQKWNDPKTSILQLKGQPKAFRGQRVKVTGTAHAIRRRALDKTLLNLNHYYEFWIDPPDRINDGLICVYSANLPSGFDSVVPEVTEKFHDIKLPVTVAGRFFKLRSYQDASKSVSHCPVVIADTFAADFQSSLSQSDAAGADWRPSTLLSLAFLAIAALVAIGIAYAVFWSTKSGTEHAQKPVSKRVERSLDALGDDESVMTDAQRVAELNEQLEEDFS